MSAYRYRLTRYWLGAAAPATFIMLNPSTADEVVDDPTIRRCIGFAKRWGCGGLVVVNLYAWRATDPRDLWAAPDPVGPANRAVLAGAIYSATARRAPLVAAWGVNGRPARVEAVVGAMTPEQRAHLSCLGMTAAGHPRHPLYVRGDALLQPWTL